VKTEGNEGNEEFIRTEAPMVDPGPNSREFAVPEEFCPAPGWKNSYTRLLHLAGFFVKNSEIL
jgi:hypothetical protein